MDAHMHFESTMLSPEALTDVIVPQGTTTLFADLMEIANVAGKDGLQAMLSSMHRLPYRMLIEVSSRVPTAPGLETTGAVLGTKEVAEIMGWEESVSLGEMDPSKILFVKDEYLQKIAAALAQRKIANGHAIGRLGQELNVYASSGISDDHECVETGELLARLRVGMKVFIREGSTERNLDELITGVLREKLDFDNLMFCTDDKQPGEIRSEGHINYNVNRAVELGVPPVKAIQMATINIAKHFRLEDELGSITPGRLADILLVDDIRHIRPNTVIFEGKIVAQNGALTEKPRLGDYPMWLKQTVHLKNPVTKGSFAVRAGSGAALVRANVIELIDRQIINRRGQAVLEVKDGLVQGDPANDILKISVVERYGKTGGIGSAFVKGFSLKSGALAYSMSHDHHNIVAVGTNDIDMAAAVNAVAQMQGGLAAARGGSVLAQMCLPIGGLMSEREADEVMAELEKMNEAAKALGCELPAPFMTLSFISLPTVPDLGLTDLGLVDVLEQKLIDVVISDY
jgi:adenine deaminase